YTRFTQLFTTSVVRVFGALISSLRYPAEEVPTVVQTAVLISLMNSITLALPGSPLSPLSPFGPWAPVAPTDPCCPAGPAGPSLVHDTIKKEKATAKQKLFLIDFITQNLKCLQFELIISDILL